MLRGGNLVRSAGVGVAMGKLAALLALTSLLLPAAVGAKGMATVRVCGADACVTLPDRTAEVISPAETVFEPPPVALYYRLEIAIDTGRDVQRQYNLYAPSSGLLAANAGAERALLWYVPRTEALKQLRPAVVQLEPFKAPRAWPLAVEEAALAGPTAAGERHWTLPVLATTLAFVALGGLVLLARRLRLRRPKTA